MNRHQRRAEMTRFRRELSGGLLSYLVDATDPRLAGQRLLSGAIAYWSANIGPRRPKCFACRTPFADAAEAGAFLLVKPSCSATSCSVSGLCRACWRDLSDAEIEAAAARALKPVAPSGL